MRGNGAKLEFCPISPAVLPRARPFGAYTRKTKGDFRDVHAAARIIKYFFRQRPDGLCLTRGSYRLEAVLQVGDNVVDVLRADTEAHGALGDALLRKLGLAEL